MWDMSSKLESCILHNYVHVLNLYIYMYKQNCWDQPHKIGARRVKQKLQMLILLQFCAFPVIRNKSQPPYAELGYALPHKLGEKYMYKNLNSAFYFPIVS